MLVAWGVFARQIGLVRALEQVRIEQRTRDHTPQSKVIEFLVALLSGNAHLQDISRGPHPLDHDQAVATAWGQSGWADYSGVSRTLRLCTLETVATIQEALAQVSRPLIEREVTLALRATGVLVYDGDLTGRPVSPTSTTYEDAGFGWMDDAVQLGYQAVLLSVRSPTYGRLWLAVRQQPGGLVSATQTQALVQAAEERTGLRPRRRTELLEQRIDQKSQALQHAQRQLDERLERLAQTQQKLCAAAAAWRHGLAEVAGITQRERATHHAGGPYSQLTRARSKVAVCWRRLYRRQAAVRQAQHAAARQAEKVQLLRAELPPMEARLALLLQENQTNRCPIRAIFRLDGGFGGGESIAWLVEMGYDIYTKAYSPRATQALRRRVPADARWTHVGENAAMLAWKGLPVDFCPYPLDVGLEHFHTGPQERYAALLHYGAEDVTQDLPGWFDFYNGRQTIEAGIKEGKQVFTMHHLKVRSRAGLAIQEEFAALAANLIRWAAVWLQEQPTPPPAPFNQTHVSIKQLVTVAANTTAWVFQQQPEGTLLLRFDELSAFAGVELCIGSTWAFQLPLPLFRSDDFGPS